MVLRGSRRRRRGADRAPMPLMLGAAAAGGTILGSLLEFFLDPRSGRRRRHTVRDRTRARVRRGERRAAVRVRRAESHAVGAVRRTINARRRSATEPLDDVTLAQKIESELFRQAQVAKGQVSVNAEDGVVFLRGTLERQEEIDRLAVAALKLDGVRDVENLLHLHGTPAPPSRTKLERERTGA